MPLQFIERQNSDSEKWRKYPAGVIPAWVADMDIAAAPPILAALRGRVEHSVFGYSCAANNLPDIIAAYFLRRWNWQIKTEWILYSPGLGAAIHNTLRLTAAGAKILTPQPIYHVFRHAPAYAGRQLCNIPMEYSGGGEWRLPLELLQKNAAGAELLQLSNPHNPNGKVFSQAELAELGEFCLRNNLILCADEVHADLILDADKKHIPIAALSPDIAARTITLQSPSKAYNIAGLNFAVVIIPNKELRAKYIAAGRGKVLSNLNPFGFAAAAAAWGGECGAWLLELTDFLRNNRNTLSAAIAKINGIKMPPLPSTYLSWLNVENLHLQNAPAHFIKHGVAMSPGADFGDPRYMRLNFGCSAPRLQEIIVRLQNAAEDA